MKYGFLRFADHCIVSVWTVCQAVCDPVQDSEDQEYNSKKCPIAKLRQIYKDKLDQKGGHNTGQEKTETTYTQRIMREQATGARIAETNQR